MKTMESRKAPKFRTRSESIYVEVGNDAHMAIPNGSLNWAVRYGRVEDVRYVAASCLDSYRYLVGGEINTTEAIRRLRLLRQAQHLNTKGETA